MRYTRYVCINDRTKGLGQTFEGKRGGRPADVFNIIQKRPNTVVHLKVDEAMEGHRSHMEVRSRQTVNLPYYLSGLVLTRKLLKLCRSAQDLTQIIRNFGCKIQMTDRLLTTTTTSSAPPPPPQKKGGVQSKAISPCISNLRMSFGRSPNLLFQGSRGFNLGNIC